MFITFTTFCKANLISKRTFLTKSKKFIPFCHNPCVGELGGLNDYIKKDRDLEGSWQAQRLKKGCGNQVTTHRPVAVTAGCNCSQLLAAYVLC